MKAAVQYTLKTRDFLTLLAFKEHYERVSVAVRLCTCPKKQKPLQYVIFLSFVVSNMAIIYKLWYT